MFMYIGDVYLFGMFGRIFPKSRRFRIIYFGINVAEGKLIFISDCGIGKFFGNIHYRVAQAVFVSVKEKKRKETVGCNVFR